MSFRSIKALIVNTMAAALGVATLSCTETIEIEFPQEDSQLVVYSLFHPDSVWEVEVSATKDLNHPGTPYPVINEATVEIYQGGQLVDVLEYQGYLDPETVIDMSRGVTYDTVFWRNETIYRSEEGFKPKADIEYTIVVSAPGYPSVKATDRIPIKPFIEIKETDFEESGDQPGFNPEEQYVEVTAVIHDIADQNNFYMAAAAYNAPHYTSHEDGTYDTLFYQQYLQLETTDIQSVRLQYFKLFSDQSFYGISYPVVFGIGLDEGFTINNTDSLTLYLGTVSEAFQRHYEAFEAQQRYGVDLINLTDPPKVYSNLEGGLGVFAGYNTVDFTIKL